MFSSLSILTVADDGSEQRYINNKNWSDRKTWIRENIFFFQKRQNNCEKLNTRLHAKFPDAILRNPYYTPCNTAHIITPPCNTGQVITPWEVWLVAFRIYHICKIKHISSKYMTKNIIPDLKIIATFDWLKPRA
jgi:hypothetical protein